MITFPKTDNELVPDIVKDLDEVFLSSVRYKEAQLNWLSTTTVASRAIITSSDIPGTVPPTHVEGIDQLPPIPVEVMVAQYPEIGIKKKRIN